MTIFLFPPRKKEKQNKNERGKMGTSIKRSPPSSNNFVKQAYQYNMSNQPV
jgi:hypothetical protein